MVPADEELIVCDVGTLAADATTVDALARMQLLARRQGYRIQLRGASPELLALLEFVGLSDLLGVGLGRWHSWQTEQPEHSLGVEEGVDPDDAIA